MGRRLSVLRKSWCIYTVLFLSGGIKSLVNQVEGPFSRSLVSCDAFTPRDTYTGSRWCGDRLTVIQGGVEIQSKGQSQENLAMLMSLTFLVVLTGVLGAKFTLLLGLLAVTMSVGLFLLACSVPRMGRSLYALAQGLQGVYPIEYLQGIIMMHLSFLAGSDSAIVFELGSCMGIVSNWVWNLAVGGLVSMLELSDYTRVWTMIFAINSAILLLAGISFPAMLPPDVETVEAGPLTRLIRELLSYRDLGYDWRARRMMFKLFFENILNPFFRITCPAMLMAYHGWSQYELVCFYTVQDLVGLVCMPLYEKMSGRYGTHFVYMWSCRYYPAMGLLKALTIPFTDKVAVFLDVTSVLMRGFEPFRAFVDARFMEPEQVQRFESGKWLVSYFQNIWLIPIYAQLFDAYAQTYLGWFGPSCLFCVAQIIHVFLVFYTIYDMDGIHGFGVTVRVQDEGGKRAGFLWWMITKDSQPQRIDHHAWKLYNLEAILALPWESTGEEGINSLSDWYHLVSMLNITPMQGQETLRKLDKAITYAYGVHEHFYTTQVQQREKATALWDMVSGSDGSINEEKWKLYLIETFLGLHWTQTGGQGVTSKEHWLDLLDPRKASKESLAKIEYCISYVERVQAAIRQAVAEAEAATAAEAEAAAAALAAWEAEAAYAAPTGWETDAAAWEGMEVPEHDLPVENHTMIPAGEAEDSGFLAPSHSPVVDSADMAAGVGEPVKAEEVAETAEAMRDAFGEAAPEGKKEV